MGRWVSGWADGWMVDRWMMDGWVSGWVDGRTDAWVNALGVDGMSR